MYMKTKDRGIKQLPLTPPYTRRGISGLPSSDEEGSGLVGGVALKAGEKCTRGNKASMSMKTKGNDNMSLD